MRLPVNGSAIEVAEDQFDPESDTALFVAAYLEAAGFVVEDADRMPWNAERRLVGPWEPTPDCMQRSEPS